MGVAAAGSRRGRRTLQRPRPLTWANQRGACALLLLCHGAVHHVASSTPSSVGLTPGVQAPAASLHRCAQPPTSVKPHFHPPLSEPLMWATRIPDTYAKRVTTRMPLTSGLWVLRSVCEARRANVRQCMAHRTSTHICSETDHQPWQHFSPLFTCRAHKHRTSPPPAQSRSAPTSTRSQPLSSTHQLTPSLSLGSVSSTAHWMYLDELMVVSK